MTLQIYIVRQLLLAFAFATTGILMIVLPSIAIQAIHKLGAVSLGVVARYLPMVVVELVPYLLPMAFLLGVVATFGRLAAERELIAVRMAGVHPARLSLPVILLAFALTGATNILLAEVCPNWKYNQRSYMRQAQVEILRNLSRGRTEIEFGASSLKADDVHDNVFEGVLLDLVREDEERLTIDAERAVLEVNEDLLTIKLSGARVLAENARLENESPVFHFSLDELIPMKRLERKRAKYHPSSRLRSELASGDTTQERADELVYEIHRRHALSVTYILFLLIGIPTGIVLRSSTQLGAFTGAIGYSFLYYLLAMRLSKELALSGAVHPLIAAWTTDAIFLVIGLVLFVRTLWR